MRRRLIIVASLIVIGVLIGSFKAWPTIGNIKGKIVLSTQNGLRLTHLDDFTGKIPTWQVMLESKDEYRYPDWSPDGTRLAMGYLSWEESKPTARGANTFYKLVIINADGRGLHYLHQGDENYEYPAWSPDGKFIAFIAYPNWPKERVGQVCLLNLSTKHLHRISKPTATIERPTWSFDSRMLAFTSSAHEIVIYHIKDDKERVLPVAGWSPLFSPKGNLIFYIQDKALCSINIDGSNKRIVKRGFFDYIVKFSRDGRYLLYAGGGSNMIPPGHEYSTLEMRLGEIKNYRLFKGSLLYGASWAE